MTTSNTMTSQRKTARLAGLLYVAMGLPAYYTLMYVPDKIMVKGDPAATARNVLENEFLVRTAIISHLFSVTLFLIMAFVLYRLLKMVNEHQSKLMIAFVMVQVPIVFIIETFRFTSLMILKVHVFKTLEPQVIEELSVLFLKMHFYGTMMLEIFMGLWLIPLGLVINKSVFIPRIIGIFLIIAGLGYVIDSITFFLFPVYRSYTMPVAFTFSGIGEGSLMLWLLIKGVKVQQHTV